jgi:hypothetical protein
MKKNPIMINRTLLLTLFILLSSFSTKHEYYVGLTEITYNSEKERLEVISRLFHDDLERVLQTRYNNNIELKPSVQSENVENFIKLYFEKKLKLFSDQQACEMEYVGYKFEDDRINIFLKIEGVKNFNSLKIINLLLTDVIEEQKNIVHCFKLNQKKSVLLTRFDSEALLNFDK